MQTNTTQPDIPSPPIAKEGWPIVAMFLVGAGVLTAGAWFLQPVLGWIVAVLTGSLCVWCLWFFRDPPRRIPAGKDLVISPADGVICFVGPARPPAELGIDPSVADRMIRISVFMNVFNVHVNRSPVEASVTAIHYHPGKFFNASLDKACEHNERCSLALRTAEGHSIACVQIAGLVARRIVCRVKVGASLRAAERFGLIRFGSRVDTYLPPGYVPQVQLREKSVAGETILARFAPEEAR
jgi:phosphatidylserine decarboxylase